MKLSNIRILPYFQRTPPSEIKMDMCRTYFKNHGVLDREIILDHRLTLTDGYVGYLVLKENGIEDVDSYVRVEARAADSRPVNPPYWTQETTYVFGKHPNCDKEYVWRIKKSNKSVDEFLRVGGKAIVSTRNGNKVITITRIETMNHSPTNRIVKKVIRCLPE